MCREIRASSATTQAKCKNATPPARIVLIAARQSQGVYMDQGSREGVGLYIDVESGLGDGFLFEVLEYLK